MKNGKKIRIFMALIVCTFLIQAKSGFAANTPVFSLISDTNDVSGKDGQCTVTLHVENAQDIRGFEAVISYDSGMVGFLQKDSTAVHSGFCVKPKIEKDKISIAFAKIGSDDSISGNTDLYRLKFTAKRIGEAYFILNTVKVVNNAGEARVYTVNSKVSVPCTTSMLRYKSIK